MNYAIVCLFGFISGILFAFRTMSWMLASSSYARYPLIKLIHDKYASEFYAYCDEKCGKTQFLIDVNQILNSEKDNASTQENREQGQSSSQEAPRPSRESSN